MTQQQDDAAGAPVARGRGAPALVFCTSAAVLVLEILAGRLVAPYVGVSLETYTGIIGTVLAGIAVGSAVGGRLADRRDPRTMLAPLLIASGASSLAVVPIIAVLGPTVGQVRGGPAGIVVLAFAAFVLPTALLSAVHPMVAKLRLATTAETGSVVGDLSAAGTAGALVGTFATGFVFVATLPSRRIVTGVGLLLIVLGVAVAIRLRRRPGSPALVAIVLFAAALEGVPPACDRETRYSCATVLVDPARPSGRTLVLDSARNSYVDLDDPTYLEFRYARLFASVIDGAFEAGALRALHIGGGGFTFPRWLPATRPGSRSLVLELDPEVVEIAEQELGLRRDATLQVRTGDARVSIRGVESGGYDLVLGDAFSGLSVPWHLTTVEMVTEIRRTLRDGGVYVLNVIDAGPRRLVRAELATLQAVFAEVAVVVPPQPDDSGNFVLVGADRRLDLSVPAADGTVLTGEALDGFVNGARPLRDDFAPADQLITRQ